MMLTGRIPPESCTAVSVSCPWSTSNTEKVLLRVTVTQRTTGALAEGVTEFAANGSFTTNQWRVLATAQGKAAFQPGPATAVGVAVTSTRGQATDAHQWLVNITLVKE